MDAASFLASMLSLISSATGSVFDRVSPSCLRHTAASLLIAAGAHPKAIQTHLGHRDITTTLNVYGHLLPSVEASLTAALDSTYEAAQVAEPEPTT